MQLLEGSPKKQLEEVVELGRSIEMRDSVVPNDSLFSQQRDAGMSFDKQSGIKPLKKQS
jgi:hypothetical protein